MKRLVMFLVAGMLLIPGVGWAQQVADVFRLPLDGSWTVTQDFGVWNSDWSGYHLGEDVLRSSEVAVYAPAKGKVKHAQSRTGFGYVVVIEHKLPDNSYVCSVMGHMRAAGLIAEGTNVTRGQQIGYLSSDPTENGGYNFTHIHFGIRQGTYVFWQYPGYGSSAERDNWYDPSDFVASHQIPAYKATKTGQNTSVTPWLPAGGSYTLWVDYRNDGSVTWKNSGSVSSGYVELRSVDGGCSLYSSFCAYDAATWINRQGIGPALQASVPNGSTARFQFVARAANTSGSCVQWVAPWANGQCMDGWGGVNFTIQTDADAPTNNGPPIANPTTNTVNSFSFSWPPYSDPQSGVKEYHWNINGVGDNNNGTAVSIPTSNYAPGPGTFTFSVWAVDNVGNTSGYNQTTFTYQPPTGPCPGREIPHTCVTYPATPCYPASAANLQILPELKVAQWQTTGQPVREMLTPGKTYSIGFEYRSAAVTDIKVGLGTFNPSPSNLVCVVSQSILPVSTNDWRTYWSAPFTVTAEQLARISCLKFLRSSSTDGLEIRNVRIVAYQ